MFRTNTRMEHERCFVFLNYCGASIAYGSGTDQTEARAHLLRMAVEVRQELTRWIDEESEALNGSA